MKTEHKRFDTPLFLICGPSGAGKTVHKNMLLEMYPDVYDFSISLSNRKPRLGEVHGKDYFFCENDTAFHRCDKEGLLLERQEVYGGIWYGTLFSEIDRIISEKKIPIVDLDVEGALDLLNRYPGQMIATALTTTVECAEQSIRKRGGIPEGQIQVRVTKAIRELERIMENAKRFHLVIERKEDAVRETAMQMHDVYMRTALSWSHQKV